MTKRLKLLVAVVVAVGVALAFCLRQDDAQAQIAGADGGAAAHRTIYPDGGSDGPSS